MVTPTLLFFYGRVPDLARYEALSVYPQAIFRRVTDSIDMVEGVTDAPEVIMDRLGGLVRVSVDLGIIETVDEVALAQIIDQQERTSRHIEFILSSTDELTVPKQTAHHIKELLVTKGYVVRFSTPTGGQLASAAQVIHRKVEEYILVPIQGKVAIARTLAVQNPDLWSKRDFGRPRVDAKRGMLPLKVARMVANIALGNEFQDRVLLDPFCGMGTIIAEGVTIGGIWKGSDLAKEAVEGTKKNLNWLSSHFSVESEMPEITQVDAVHLSSVHASSSIDVIVTEPFLGNPKMGEDERVDPKEIRNIIRGLEKLYIGCFKDWYQLLKPNGRIVIALPEINIGEHKETVKKLIDTCEILGYSIEAGPFAYGRPQATVLRQFYIFKKIALTPTHS